MQENKVRFDKPFGATNTKWQFVACDILSNIKPLAVHRETFLKAFHAPSESTRFGKMQA